MKKLTDNLVKHGALMFFASSIANAFSMFFQLFMVRKLTPINYGIVNSLFGILLLISIPLGPVQTVITKFVSNFYAHRQLKKIRSLLLRLGKRILVFGLIIFSAFIFGSRIISSFLQISSNSFVMITGCIMLLSIVLPFTYGGLQGFQRFDFLSINIILTGMLKLLLGIVLITIGFEVIGALAAVGISTFIALVLSLLMLGSALGNPPALSEAALPINSDNPISNGEIMEEENLNLTKVYRYFIPVSITFLCFMALTNVDIILVKHFFAPVEAGYYSIAQMVGKIILFLPVAIIMVMFTKVSHFHAQNEDTMPILKKTLVIIGVLSGTGAVICLFFPSLIIKLLSGKVYLECLPLARLFGIAMTFFALTYALLLYNLSIHRFSFIRPLVFFSVMQIILICFFHRTLTQIIYILVCNSFLLFISILSSMKNIRNVELK